MSALELSPDRLAPQFSVVIASFNSASWIESTVRSALDQAYAAHEIIVVGDGCTDRTDEILASKFGDAVQWANLDRNWGGQSFPNNEGIRHASGTHVAYLGHDDIWSPHHLEQLARVVREQDPDFAVSGAIYHAPPGSRYYRITGLFDDPGTAETEFFPPSSFAHRRDVTERIGLWRDPTLIRAPADCEFLLRAVRKGCRFASTKTITVHKFAAGHRYLSYRFPSGLEQERMLRRLRSADEEATMLDEIRQDIDDGADNPPVRYIDFDAFPAGRLNRRNRGAKGLEKAPAIAVDGPRWFPVGPFAAGLDWYDPEKHRTHGLFRWSGPNPNPRYLLNVRVHGAFQVRIHIIRFADDELAASLTVEADRSRDRVYSRARRLRQNHTHAGAHRRARR